MPTTDSRVDAYIAKSAPFARPILTHLRTLVRTTCPEAQETIKWGVPHYDHHGILCAMAAFKAHAVFGFWKGKLVTGNEGKALEAMGSLGRLTKLSDLPSKRVLVGFIRRAAKLNESGTKVVRPTKHTPAAARRAPAYLTAALRTRAKARAYFASLSPSQRAEYIEWLTEAKRPETREIRLVTTLKWLGEGKVRHWKHIS